MGHNNMIKNNPGTEMINFNCESLNCKRVILPLFSLLIFTISGCTGKQATETNLLSQLEKQNQDLNTKVESLQQKLHEKQDEIKKLVLSQQQSTREVVRSKAKLRSHSSKANTVANIAEVKTILKAISGKTMSASQQQTVSEIEQTITMSVAALNEGDIEKAFNLSSKAQQLLQPIHAPQGKNALSNGSKVVFVTPLTMEVLTTCNVRTGPGMKNSVQFILRQGTQIKTLAYLGNWVQVESDKKGKGWVYYKLLEKLP